MCSSSEKNKALKNHVRQQDRKLMQSACSRQTPFYHKGKILADSKNSVLAEGPIQPDHSKLPLCPGSVKGCTHGQLL